MYVLFLLVFFKLLPCAFARRFAFVRRLFSAYCRVIFTREFSSVNVHSRTCHFNLHFVVAFHHRSGRQGVASLRVFASTLRRLCSVRVQRRLINSCRIKVVGVCFLRPLRAVVNRVGVRFVFRLRLRRVTWVLVVFCGRRNEREQVSELFFLLLTFLTNENEGEFDLEGARHFPTRVRVSFQQFMVLLARLRFGNGSHSLPFEALYVSFPVVRASGFLERDRSSTHSLVVDTAYVIDLQRALRSFKGLTLKGPRATVFRPCVAVPIVVQRSRHSVGVSPNEDRLRHVKSSITSRSDRFLLVHPCRSVLANRLRHRTSFVFFNRRPRFFLGEICRLVRIRRQRVRARLTILCFARVRCLVSRLRRLFNVLFRRVRVLRSFLE